MPFDWRGLEPVRLRVDTRELQGVAAALAAWPEATTRALREVLERHGGRVSERVRENLSGTVLGVRSGRLRGSWVAGMVDDLSWAGHSRIGYGALWERGYTARAGIYPARAKAVPRQRGKGQRWVLDAARPELPAGDVAKLSPGVWRLTASTGAKSYPMVWVRTRGGYRAPRPWAQPALDAQHPEFVREVNRTVVKVWTWLT